MSQSLALAAVTNNPKSQSLSTLKVFLTHDNLKWMFLAMQLFCPAVFYNGYLDFTSGSRLLLPVTPPCHLHGILWLQPDDSQLER